MAKNRIFRRRRRRKRKTRRGRKHGKRKTRRRRRRKRKTRIKRGGGVYKGLRPGDRVQLSPDGIRRVLAGNSRDRTPPRLRFPVWSTYNSQPLAPYLQDPGSWRGKVKYARKGGWGTYYAGKIWVQWTFPRNNATNQIIEIQYEDLWQDRQPTNYNLHGGPVNDIEHVNDGSEALQPGG